MKTIIITGANGTTGSCACQRFHELGYRVIGVDLSFSESEYPYETYTADLTDFHQVQELINTIAQTAETVDCLYNIAGGSGRKYGDGPVDQCTEEGFEKTLQLNLATQFYMCKYVLPLMLKQKSGCIINTASVLGMMGGGELFATHAYAAAKAGIIGMSRAMASQYAKDGIRVNVIAPGLMETNMSLRAQNNEEIWNYMDYKQPIYAGKHKLGQVRSLVKAAEFLCSEEADFVTGIVLPVDGGWSTL